MIKINKNNAFSNLFLNIEIEKQIPDGPFIKGTIPVTIYKTKDEKYAFELIDGVDITLIRYMGQELTDTKYKDGNIAKFCASHREMGIDIQSIICDDFEKEMEDILISQFLRDIGITLP